MGWDAYAGIEFLEYTRGTISICQVFIKKFETSDILLCLKRLDWMTVLLTIIYPHM